MVIISKKKKSNLCFKFCFLVFCPLKDHGTMSLRCDVVNETVCVVKRKVDCDEMAAVFVDCLLAYKLKTTFTTCFGDVTLHASTRVHPFLFIIYYYYFLIIIYVVCFIDQHI